ncbi:GlxA family transcriptional regulator [Variovorax sp. PBL-E5]|uniref:GlxA family transcriptional regulator n=1 Tax=Variovorax sp. PBL-E5 TaxID=434014 RepID=UPI001316234E|nr:helix-turn-helix domain-containing protein [Variovorax sp. PBL-E5]VTU38426.1 Carnitine catabolism transcriptional activator [Variovorax sp. PBL-E5]
MTPDVAPSGRRVRVAILAPEHALGWTIMGPADMLNSAGTLWSSLQGESGVVNRFEVAIVGRSGQPVVCFQGMRLMPETGLDDAGYEPDVILVPALFEESVRFGRSGWSTPWRPFVEWIKVRHARGAFVAAISTGVALLAETSLLDGHKATTHWAMMEAMAANYRRIEFVHHNGLQSAGPGSRLVTTAAGTAWQSLVLLLVARFAGAQQSIELARLFSTQSLADQGKRCCPGFVPPSDHGDAQVLRAQRAIAGNFGDADVLMDAMEKAGMTRRTFERRFRAATGYSPLAYLQEVRMQRARHLLDSTVHGVDEVAGLVGYGDVAHFRSLFTRMSGMTPSHYREAFGMGGMLEMAQQVL